MEKRLDSYTKLLEKEKVNLIVRVSDKTAESGGVDRYYGIFANEPAAVKWIQGQASSYPRGARVSFYIEKLHAR